MINEIVNKLPISKQAEWIRFSLSIIPFPIMRHLAEAQLLNLVLSNKKTILGKRINTIESKEVSETKVYQSEQIANRL